MHRIARAAGVLAVFSASSASVFAQHPVEVPLPSQAPPWTIVNQRGAQVTCDTSPWQKVDLGTVAGMHIYSGDHCSMPSPDPISAKFKEVFSRACDLHDICYLTPGNTKGYCDDLVKWRWDQDCSHAYSSSNPLGRDECHVAAKAWRTGLNSSISDQYWSRSQAWGGQHCRVTSAANTGPATPVTWTPYQGGALPGGAIFAGSQAVCRVPYQGGVHAGRVVGANCDIGYGGREVALPGGEVLHAPAGSVSWFPLAAGIAMPPQAVVAGMENGQPRVVCRARVANVLYGGKVVGDNCNIGVQGQEATIKPFDVLVFH
jgi:hypothetical protein